MVKFYKITNRQDVARVLIDTVSRRLNKGKVLWLIGGGSVIDIAIETANGLEGHDNLNNLTVTLTDERFGAAGHADSNWRQILNKGFLVDGASLKPILTGLRLEATVAYYSDLLENYVSTCDYSVALGGMGADGHIFGIKPHSPAIDSQQLVVGYEWQDYTRITPTIRLIKQLSEVIIYASGEEKRIQLDRIELEVPAQDQPAQLLKQVKRVSIYNDYKGGKL